MASVPASRRSTRLDIPCSYDNEESPDVLASVPPASQTASRRASTKPPTRSNTKTSEIASSRRPSKIAKAPSRKPSAAQPPPSPPKEDDSLEIVPEDPAATDEEALPADPSGKDTPTEESTADESHEKTPMEEPPGGESTKKDHFEDHPAEDQAAEGPPADPVEPDPVSDTDDEAFIAKHRESQIALEEKLKELERKMTEALQLAEEVKDPEPPQELGRSSTSKSISPKQLPATEIMPEHPSKDEQPTPPIVAPRTSSRAKTSDLPVDGDITEEKKPSVSASITLPPLGPPEAPQSFDFGAGGEYSPKPISRHRTRADSVELKNKSHVDVESGTNVTLGRTHRRSPIARDWPDGRKRFTAIVTCINTTLIGIIVGIYAGEVPAIQYAIVDQSHYTILGNVVFFVGMAIPLLFCYPLPMLHGRKPYTLAGLAMLMPLLFPQALATELHSDVSTGRYHLMLLIPRALAGVAAGFIEINLMPTLLDLFGASLQSSHPHEEVVDENDVRRHGGGMGAWLSIWTWCAIGSIGFGFFLGAAIITEGAPVTWGFYISIICCGLVLILNISAPETRRSPYRRSVAEVRSGTDLFRRIAKGEYKMHLYQTGPKHWYEEMIAG